MNAVALRKLLLFCLLGLAGVWSPVFSAPNPTESTPACVPASTHDQSVYTSLDPIIVGPRNKVGTESLASKTAKSAAGSLLSSVLGGSSSGGSSSKGPKTRRDPTRKQDFLAVERPVLDSELDMRAKWTDDGLLVSTRIEDSPDKGTFQQVYLEDCHGRKLGPSKLEIYKVWSKATLTVSWTRTSYVDGNMVSQESGGWSESWTSDQGTYVSDSGDTPAELIAVWQKAGYDRAHAGIRHLGAYFNVTPEQLTEQGSLGFIAHLTRPDQDPVDTRAFNVLLASDDEGLLLLSDPGVPVDGSQPDWDQWRQQCPSESNMAGVVECDEESQLTAELTGLVLVSDPPSDDGALASTSPVKRGYDVPPGVTLGPPVSTGRTTGTIAEVEVHNGTDEPIIFPEAAVLIPASDEHQGYVVPGGDGTTVEPGETRTVPLEGYCTDVRKPPVPDGQPLPDPSGWTVPKDPTVPLPAPGDPGFDDQPDDAKIIGGAEAITRATEELQSNGELHTPFSSNPERERETVNQQTIWRFTAGLEGRPYTREEFGGRLEDQYEEQTGVPIADAPKEDKEKLQSGADDFWEAFELVGEKAKVLEPEEEVPAEEVPATTTEEVPVPVTTEAPMCSIERTMEHSESESVFKMSENYKDEDKRKNLSEWFDELPEIADTEEGGTFEASKYPASAWAVAGRDFIGGFSNGVAKHVFLEAEGGTDWVWSTEKLEVIAKSRGTHTITITPPAGVECETLVVGAEGGVVEAWSNAIDPIADSRDIITALQWIRDSAIIVASVALAPATAGASLAIGFGSMIATKAFDSEFSADANAGAAAEGQMKLWVGGSEINLAADSRSEVTGDGDITSDGQKTTVGQISDTHPTTLSANTNGLAALKAQAEDNGIAEATLESQIGIAMVGICRCGDAVQVAYLNDSGLFLVEEGAAGAATAATRLLGEMLGKVVDPYMELPPEEIIPKARADMPKELEGMLKDWYMKNGSDPGNSGYFGATSQSPGG